MRRIKMSFMWFVTLCLCSMLFWTGCSQNNSEHHDVDEQLVVEYEYTHVIDDGVSGTPEFRYLILTPVTITEIPGVEHDEDLELQSIHVDTFRRVPFEWAEGELARRVNGTIITYMTAWITDLYNEWGYVEIMNRLPNNFSVFVYSYRYYSFVSIYRNTALPGHFIADYITIDMQTGQRVMLHDLIDLSDEFIHLLHTGRIVRGFDYDMAFLDYSSEFLWSWIEEMSFEELRERVDGISMTMMDALDSARNRPTLCPISDALARIEERNNFYIAPGRLVLVFWRGSIEYHLTIHLDDIADYLLVDPW